MSLVEKLPSVVYLLLFQVKIKGKNGHTLMKFLLKIINEREKNIFYAFYLHAVKNAAYAYIA